MTPSITFRLNQNSGVPAYQQIVLQIKHALRLGSLVPGDQLPTVREVVATIPLNPNTVFKAYRELEMVESRQGQGTFITNTINESKLDFSLIEEQLTQLVRGAYQKGLEREDLEALFTRVLYNVFEEAAL